MATSSNGQTARLDYTHRQLAGCVDRLCEEWLRDHEGVRDLWIWEDAIKEANRLFDRILEIDVDSRMDAMQARAPLDTAIHTQLVEMTGRWFELATRLSPRLDKLELDFGPLECISLFRENVSEARGMLTPDEEFFASDKLADLRDRAMDAEEAGKAMDLLPI